MERRNYKQSGTGIGHIVDVIRSARPWSLCLRRTVTVDIRFHGLNEYDYGARWYDPVLARFTTIDPLCEKYYSISPYAYCANNPVNAVDLDGRKIRLVGNKEQRAELLGLIQSLTHDGLNMDKNGFVSISGIRTYNPQKDQPIGSMLISQLVYHDNTVSVEYSRFNNYHTSPEEDKENAYDGKGTNVTVFVAKNDVAPLLVKDSKSGRSIWENVPRSIGIGHELIHAYRAMEGILERKDKVSSYKYKNEHGKDKDATCYTEELETTGLFGDYIFTENKLREEMGFNRRIKY